MKYIRFIAVRMGILDIAAGFDEKLGFLTLLFKIFLIKYNYGQYQ